MFQPFDIDIPYSEREDERYYFPYSEHSEFLDHIINHVAVNCRLLQSSKRVLTTRANNS